MAENPRMYILSGVAFAGKSTLANEISSITGMRKVSIDDITQERGLVGKDISGREFTALWSDLDKRAGESVKEGRDTIVDTCSMTKTRRDQLREIAKQNKATPILVYVDISYEEARQRWTANNEHPTRAPLHINNFEYVLEHYEPPIQEEHIVFHARDNISEWITNNISSNNSFPSRSD